LITAPYKYSYLLIYLLTYLLMSFLLKNIYGSCMEKAWAKNNWLKGLELYKNNHK